MPVLASSRTHHQTPLLQKNPAAVLSAIESLSASLSLVLSCPEQHAAESCRQAFIPNDWLQMAVEVYVNG